MSTRIVPVDASNTEAFIEYALERGPEFDESWVQPEDLATFDASKEPAALALGVTGETVGAASLMLGGYAEEGLARFRILNATDSCAYGDLVANVVDRAPASVKEFFLFVPDDPRIGSVLAKIGFSETRRAHVLRREGTRPVVPVPPTDVRLAVARPDRDGQAWARVLNLAFAGFPGRFNISAERADELLSSERVLPGGALIAWRLGHPVGLVLVASEPEEDGVPLSSVDTLAVVPAAQGEGLGRLLLRAGVALAHDAGYERVDLSTNALNEKALGLYHSEGFDFIDVRVCWALERNKT
jgi:mycothiol synthase